MKIGVSSYSFSRLVGSGQMTQLDVVAKTKAMGFDFIEFSGLSLPAGFGEGGMPVGLQLIGNYFAEGKLLNAAHRFQQATDFHLQRPAGI